MFTTKGSEFNYEKREAELSPTEKKLSTMIHHFAEGFIASYNKKTLVYMIESNLYPPIMQLRNKFLGNPIFMKIWDKARDYYLKNKQKVFQYFNYEEIIHQVKEHRSDLLDIIDKPKTRTWFMNLMNSLRDIMTKDFEIGLNR